MSWQKHEDFPYEKMTASVTIVSDSLFSNPDLIDQDESGTVALEVLSDMGIGHTNLDYLPDDLSGLKTKIEQDGAKGVDLIILIGGTGISKRDNTYEAIESVIEKQIYGFGEEFRRLSIQKIGPYGMLSRAIAGTYRNSMVVGVPGSPNATRTGVSLALSILGHVIQLLKKEE